VSAASDTLEVAVLIAMAANLTWLNYRETRRRRGTDGLVCPHAWGMWEVGVLNDGWHWVNGKKVQKTLTGQYRDCSMCGEREVRKVETKVGK
jgi:hypothetical protein